MLKLLYKLIFITFKHFYKTENIINNFNEKEEYLKTVAIHKCLSNKSTSGITVLYFLSSYVFSLK